MESSLSTFAEQEETNENLLTSMKLELEHLKTTHNRPSDLDEFFKLYQRFLNTKHQKLDWSKIEEPKGKLIQYSDLPEFDKGHSKLLDKLAVLKLNGGLGTTMGMVGPKSAIRIKNDKNFIDLVYTQLSNLNRKYNVKVPLILMNSFNTHERTKKLIGDNREIKTIMQSMCPRISAENMLPISGDQMWYPPGHGDVFYTLKTSGLLDELIAAGKEYIFLSNIDNLAATVDMKILQNMIDQDLDYCMEVTDKTRADIKGGTLINYNGKLTTLEIAQVPKDKKSEFTSIRKFKVFNTNSIWVKLSAIKNIDFNKFNLDIIQNNKVVNGEKVIQLETAMGSAIKYFEKNCGIVVPRSRFLPIKTCSDLFLVKSDLFDVIDGNLVYNKNRVIKNNPVVKLVGDNYKNFYDFEDAFETIPHILDLEILTVAGNVKFEKNVTLRGIVIIMAPEKSELYIPSGSVLEDSIITGNLSVSNV